jgi:magnesium transporter
MDRPEKTVISRRPDGNARRKKQRASRDAAHRKIGMMPGSLVYVGEPRDEAATISVVDFDATTHDIRRAEKPDDVFTYRDSSTNSWIRVVGLHDVRAVEQLGAHFRIHPLTLEDIVNTNVRPRYEDTGEYLSVIVKALEYNPDLRALTIRQIAVVWGRNWVISFEEGTGSIFGAVQERIEKTVPRQRMIHPDYLAYALIDLVVDQYFLAFEHLGDQIEEIEDSLVQNDQQDRLGDILALKRVLTSIRRAVWPVRETVSMLERSDSSLILKETHLYIRDLYEHSLQVLDTVETSREMTSGLLDIYLTSVSNRMNSVMKVLTIIATIFIPLSFLAGVYGMNFDTSLGPLNMPELGLPYGYLLFWAMAIAIGGGLLIWFRRKRWL